MRIKIFIGYPLLFDFKDLAKNDSTLQAIRHHGKEYIGCYFEEKLVTTKEIKEKASQLAASLQAHSTHINCEHLPCLIFPEIFMG